MIRATAWASVLIGLMASTAAPQVTAPDVHLGRPLGRDFELADWNEVSSYFRTLAAESAHVDLLSPGRTTSDRELLLVVLGSEENLSRLAEVRALNARVADPRGLRAEERETLLARATPTLLVTCNMHSTETASPQFAMELAHRWATSQDEVYVRARERLVVLLVPSLNPDGLDDVVSWYRRTVGTPHEGADLLELYHRYAGHDNNRDWFMVSQAETRWLTRILYEEWFPHVVWDVHEQGSKRERFFVPPFRDPLDPNLDAAVITALGTLGGRMLHDLTSRGLAGVSTGVTYDMWWNGGNRNVPVRHNVPALLTEAASVSIASPVWLAPDELEPPRGLPVYAPSNRFPLPWPGGWWRLRDIIDYELAAAESLLASLAREPDLWPRTVHAAARRSIAEGEAGAPRAWIVPADGRDVDAVARLVDVLLRGGVELHVATETLRADGRSWPAGSLVVLRAQPYGRYAKDLLEVQRYPEGIAPYDVTGWTLSLLLGVHRVEVMGDLQGELERVTRPEAALEAFPRPDEPFVGTSTGWRLALSRLAAGACLVWPGPEQDPRRLGDGREDEGARVVGLPRLGLYAPWSGLHDEGWTRWVLEDFGLPYTRLRPEALRAGRLRDEFDVLLLPSQGNRGLDSGRLPGSVPAAHVGGLEPEGSLALQAFVREGGTLIAFQDAAQWVVDRFELPLEDVSGQDDFSCPGALVGTVPQESRWTADLPASLPVFFSHARAWAVDDGDGIEVLLRYASDPVLLSGWIRSPQVIAGRAAWVRARVGQGRLHLFAFRPFYRGWTQADFPLVFTAALLDAPVPER